MREIELRELFQLFRRKAKIVLITTALSILICIVLTFYVLEPQYEAYTTFIVGVGRIISNDENIRYSDVLLNEKLVATYKEIAKSIAVSNEVIKNLKLDITYEEFSEKVRVIQVEDTEIIKISVTDRDPEFAVKITNEVSDVFLKHVKSIMKMENVQILDKAKIPAKPIRPRPSLYMIISVGLGALAGIFIVLLDYYFDKTVKTQGDIDKYLKLPIIGVIPKISKKKGKKENNSIINIHKYSDFSIVEAFRILKTNVRFSNIDKDKKSILVTSPSKAEGKTTVAVNLAISMVNSHNKILLIDGNLRQPSIYKYFGLKKNKDISSALDEYIKGEGIGLRTDIKGLHVLFFRATLSNPVEFLESDEMKKILEIALKYYDTIIIDSPPVGLVTDAAVLSTIADGVILVCASEETNIDLAKNAKTLLEKVSANIIGVVLNKVPIVNGYL